MTVMKGRKPILRPGDPRERDEEGKPLKKKRKGRIIEVDLGDILIIQVGGKNDD